jgi:hypothetical protein
MAYPNRPSLMGRLFPSEDRPVDQLSFTEDPSSSTLVSAENGPFGSSSSASFRDGSSRRNDLYQACFASFSNIAAEDRRQTDRTVEGDILAPLKSMSAIKPRPLSRALRLCPLLMLFLGRGLCRRGRRIAQHYKEQTPRGSARYQF